MARSNLTGERILQTLREHDRALRKYSVRRIALFGSYAKGKETASSDIDFLVEFDRPSCDNFFDLVEYLEGLFGQRVDVLTPIALDTMRVAEVAESIRESLIYA